MAIVAPKTISDLRNKRVCITGSLDRVRHEVERDLRAMGAIPVDSVNSRTDVLLVGEKPGNTKMQAARRYGIPVIRAQDVNLSDLTVEQKDDIIAGRAAPVVREIPAHYGDF